MLLSGNDFKRLQKALDERREDSFTMTLNGDRITVSVVPVGKGISVWNQTHIISAEQWIGNVYYRKYCKTIEELRWYLSG